MKIRIFAVFVLTILAVSGHATDTNHTAVVSTNKAVSESSNALAILAKAGNAGNTPQTAIVSTNKPGHHAGQLCQPTRTWTQGQ